MNIDDAVAHYVHLRDTLKELDKQHKKRTAPVKQDMELIEAYLQRHMNDEGVQQLKSEHGTAYQTELVSTKVEDWDGATLPWIIENEAWDLLVRNVNKSAVKELGEVPGVAVSTIRKVNIRRA